MKLVLIIPFVFSFYFCSAQYDDDVDHVIHKVNEILGEANYGAEFKIEYPYLVLNRPDCNIKLPIDQEGQYSFHRKKWYDEFCITIFCLDGDGCMECECFGCEDEEKYTSLCFNDKIVVKELEKQLKKLFSLLN